jgi:hypothetical protein
MKDWERTAVSSWPRAHGLVLARLARTISPTLGSTYFDHVVIITETLHVSNLSLLIIIISSRCCTSRQEVELTPPIPLCLPTPTLQITPSFDPSSPGSHTTLLSHCTHHRTLITSTTAYLTQAGRARTIISRPPALASRAHPLGPTAGAPSLVFSSGRPRGL